MRKNFLVELGTEELPPKALSQLISNFQKGVEEGLNRASFRYESIRPFATPRRLALLIENLSPEGEPQSIEKRGPIRQAALLPNGDFGPAALGFAKTCGVDVSALIWEKGEKGEYLFYRGVEAGESVAQSLPKIIQAALSNLPVPKVMRWGDYAFGFVRPVQWLVMLYGDEKVDGECYGVKSDRLTYGHRIHAPGPFSLTNASDYESVLHKGYVQADPLLRAASIEKTMRALAKNEKAELVFDADLLDEVNSMVEWPVPLVCEFESRFLEVPKEALISAMKGHQKCFALEGAQGNLLAKFITVTNLESQDVAVVKAGNERVMRARLSDAAFFYEKDLKQGLESLLPRLESVTFQAKLGSVADKVRRLGILMEKIGSGPMGQRAAKLSKADLMSEMVYEFPELQGIMGRYYAKAQGESDDVAEALFEQYLPRFSGDSLPQTLLGKQLAMVDRIDTLVGIFSIGLKPTGSKDPFALRRAMIGLIRLLTEGQLEFDLFKLFSLSGAEGACLSDLKNFAMDRLKTFWVDEKKYELTWVVSVLSQIEKEDRADLKSAEKKLQALIEFSQDSTAQACLGAFKRAANLIQKQTGLSEKLCQASELIEPAEKALFESLTQVKQALGKIENFPSSLSTLKTITPALTAFFDEVMVMVDDQKLRENRLALIQEVLELGRSVGLE